MLVAYLWRKPITLIVVIAVFMLIKQCKEEARENTRVLYTITQSYNYIMNKQHTTWVIIIFAVGTTTSAIALFLAQLTPQLTYGSIAVQGPESRVTLAVSSDNIYIAWITNKTGNDQVMFRSSNDAGATFNDKIILSNITNAKLQDI